MSVLDVIRPLLICQCNIAAGLNMTEPSSTGIGGDMFCLYYDATTRKVSALNGSGRSGGNCTLETICKDLGLEDGEGGKIPLLSVHSVTVPGAAAGWVDTVEKFGSGNLTMADVLAPAIEMGERGFPVSELTSKSVSERCSPMGFTQISNSLTSN
jgi:gamma-glutamyltranspeptidase/glutathione hydrolase